MKLEDIQELGHAAISLKVISDNLTDDNAKAKLIREAGIVMDAHDEMLAEYQAKGKPE